MDSFSSTFWFLILPLITVAIATYTDIRWRIIPNKLTMPAILIGLILHTIHAGWSGFILSLLGLTVGGGLLLILHFAGGMGAGDVKLMGAIGALTGPATVMSALLLSCLFGGLYAFVKIVIDKSRNKPYTILPGSQTIRENVPAG